MIKQVVVADSSPEVGRIAAAKIAQVIRSRADAVLGLATGSSPLSIYAELRRQVHDEGLAAGASARSPSTSTSVWPPTTRRAIGP